MKPIELKNPEFITDENGTRKKIILDYDNFLELMEYVEDQLDSKLIQQTRNEDEISLEDYLKKRNV